MGISNSLRQSEDCYPFAARVTIFRTVGSSVADGVSAEQQVESLRRSSTRGQTRSGAFVDT